MGSWSSFQGYRYYIPPRLESAGRCSAPWQGPEHTVAGAERLQGSEPGKQKEPSFCKPPVGLGSLKKSFLIKKIKVPMVVCCLLVGAVANPLK